METLMKKKSQKSVKTKSEITSKTSLFLLIRIPLSLLFGIGILLLEISAVYKEQEMPFVMFMILTTFSSIGLTIGFFGIINFKSIRIESNEIAINFPLKKKILKYSFEQVIGFDERFNRIRFEEFRTFTFRTSDNTIIIFSSKEFRNYDDLAYKISTICRPSKIGFNKNAIPLLKYFTASFLIVSFLFFMTTIIL